MITNVMLIVNIYYKTINIVIFLDSSDIISIMFSKRHPVTDVIHDKIIKLIIDAQDRGYSLEKIALMCDLTQPMLSGLLMQPGQPGYRGSRISLDTVIKLWTGLGKPLSELFEDVVDVEPAGKIVNVVKILETEKKVLEFDLKVMDTVLARRASTPKKMEQVRELAAITKELLESVNQALNKLQEYLRYLESTQKTAPTPQPSRETSRKTKKRN